MEVEIVNWQLLNPNLETIENPKPWTANRQALSWKLVRNPSVNWKLLDSKHGKVRSLGKVMVGLEQ